MKHRYLYLLLFSVPALIASLLAGFVALAGAAGMLWLFVYGDDPWPRAAETALLVLFAAVSLAAGAVCFRRAYRAGEQLEKTGAAPPIGRLSIAAAGLTTMLLILVGLYQWNIGNIGPKSDSVVCSDFCASRGFVGSSMPPRNAGPPTCTCVDAGGRDALAVPMQEARRP